jgi:hypothetical protein
MRCHFWGINIKRREDSKQRNNVQEKKDEIRYVRKFELKRQSNEILIPFFAYMDKFRPE